MAEANQYTPGDWIVHRNYGVGQIKAIEEMPIGGEDVSCLKVKTNNSTFWVPLDNADSERLRPVVTEKAMKRALAALGRPPKEMHSNHKRRKSRIKKALQEGSMTGLARLVRDLHARQELTRLNQTEETALSRITDRFVREWSVSMGIQVDSARRELNRILRENLEENVLETS